MFQEPRNRHICKKTNTKCTFSAPRHPKIPKTHHFFNVFKTNLTPACSLKFEKYKTYAFSMIFPKKKKKHAKKTTTCKHAVIIGMHLRGKTRYYVNYNTTWHSGSPGVPPTEIRTLSRTRGGVLGEGVFHCKMNRFMDIGNSKGKGQPTRLRAQGPGGF